MPRVSVIVPAYRAERFVGEAVASVRAQTYGDWEVLVTDDASDDATAQSAEDAGATVVRSSCNLGPAGARNLAIERASGEVMAFLDADDLWLPQYLERQLACLDTAGPGVGLVACDALVRTAHGDAAYTYLEQFSDPVEPLTLQRVLRGDCIYVSSLVPRVVGDEVGWFDAELFGTEDHDLWLRILERRHVAVLNREVLAVYRHRADSVSSNLASQGRNNQKTYVKALARGRLDDYERSIAREALRYNVAMEAVASAWFERRPSLALRRLPTIMRILSTRRDLWSQWSRVLVGRPARNMRAMPSDGAPTARSVIELRARPAARRAALAGVRLLSRVGLAEPAFRVYERIVARSGEGTHKDEHGIPVPPPHLRVKVWGSTYLPGFLDGGEAVARLVRDETEASGLPLTDAGTILDFGCGCGRVLRHWPALADAQLTGCDYNPELVAWVNDNLPGAHAEVNGLAPPLPFDDDAFGLVYAISVFTHLTLDLQHAWMAELRRVLRPGGRLVFSTHGDVLKSVREPREQLLYEQGLPVVRFGGAAGSNLCTTFHPPAWVRDELAPRAGFEIVRSALGGREGLGDHDLHVAA